jgi:conjugal transfer/entry exclusion protein
MASAKVRIGLDAVEGIALRLQATQSGYEQLFPRQVSATLSSDDVLRNAKTRWEEEHAAFQRSALLQGQIAESAWPLDLS